MPRAIVKQYRIKKNPNRVRFLKISRSGTMGFEILRPPCRLDYVRHFPRDEPPYARILFYWWNKEQWRFGTRARWLLGLTFERNWKRIFYQVYLCGYVVYQKNIGPDGTDNLTLPYARRTPYRIAYRGWKWIREHNAMQETFD